ncbi:glycosyltransferase [Streptomyces thinghirensis]|nr:glycosyltransferase [Streptomyces thinghirensis]
MGVAGRLSQSLDSVSPSPSATSSRSRSRRPGPRRAGRRRGRAERDLAGWRPCAAAVGRASPGRAQHAGMRAATGAYLLFLDGDDVHARARWPRWTRRLADTGGVDVLHFEHERVPWWEGEPTNPAAPLLARRARTAPSPPDRAPHLTGVRLPAWSAGVPPYLPHRAAAGLPPTGTSTDDRLRRPGRGARRARGRAGRSIVVRHLVRRQGRPAEPAPVSTTRTSRPGRTGASRTPPSGAAGRAARTATRAALRRDPEDGLPIRGA